MIKFIFLSCGKVGWIRNCSVRLSLYNVTLYINCI
nr:MAG TPA: hypothetical protein [Caudoviricetes sp.]